MLDLGSSGRRPSTATGAAVFLVASLAIAGLAVVSAQPVVLGKRPFQHGGSVEAAAFSLDGTRIASVSADGQLSLWPSSGAEPLWRVPVTGKYIRAVAFSPRDTYVACATSTSMQLHDARTGKLVWTTPLRDYSLEALGFTADETELSGVDGWLQIRAWASSTGQLLRELPRGKGDVLAATLSRDAKLVASSHDDGTVRIRETGTGKVVRELQGPPVKGQSLDFSPASDRLALGERYGNRVIVWELGRGSRVCEASTNGSPVRSVRFFTRGERLLVSARDVAILELSKNSWIRVTQPAGVLRRSLLSADDRLLALVDGSNVLQVDEIGKQRVLTVPGHRSAVTALAFTRSDEVLLSGGEDGAVLWWEVVPGRERLAREVIPGGPGSIAGVAAVPDGTRVVASRSDVIEVWDAAANKKLADLRDGWDMAGPVHISADGRQVISAHPIPDGDGAFSFKDGLRIWALPGASPRLFSDGDMRGAHAIAGSADGKSVTFISYRYGGGGSPMSPGVGVLNIATGKVAGSFSPVLGEFSQALALNAPGNRAAFASGGRIAVFEVPSGKLVGEAPASGGGVSALALSPDGQLLASGHRDGSLRLTPATGNGGESWVLAGGPVRSLAFSARPGTLVAGLEDGSLRIIRLTR